MVVRPVVVRRTGLCLVHRKSVLYDVQVDSFEPERSRRRDPRGGPAVPFSTLT
ncbi:hypothetical protein SGL43_04026 [Streptomyces globisporus]|uniref:Uncharacterized protein n=1 Tax=Streptomyces globisporus TaxID=1908 RepID=A0ABM9H093_STRGL|nr:hypothetical protein SGL43_04026 [Streptomyces globisporus]